MSVEYRKNMEGWVLAMRNRGSNELAKKFYMDTVSKIIVLRQIAEAGLPTYPILVMSMGEFLEDSVSVMEMFKHPLYWASLTPKDPMFPKITKVGVRAEEIIAFIQKYTGSKDQYDTLISAYENNIYGGSIISTGDQIYAELISGNQINLAQGNTDKGEPFVAKKGGRDRSFIYSTDDSVIREMFWKALKYLRLNDSPHHPEFMRGYFEFAVTESPQRPYLGIQFLDWQTSPSFLTLPAI